MMGGCEKEEERSRRFVTNQGGIEPPGFLTECLIFKFVCSFPPVANQNPCLDNGERNDTSNHPRMLTGVARLVGYCTHEPVEPIDRVEGGAVVVVDGGAVAWGQLRSLKSQDLPLSFLAVTPTLPSYNLLGQIRFGPGYKI